MVVFNATSADFVLMSADVVLKTTTILKEMSIAQLSFLKWTVFKLYIDGYFDTELNLFYDVLTTSCGVEEVVLRDHP